MQFQVPQNIELEDKIVGPLTLKNFLILLFGGMFIYLLFFLPLPRTIIIIIAAPIAIAILLISFVKIQDQSFIKFFTSLIYFWLRPKQRIWNQNDPTPIVKIKGKTKKEKVDESAKQKVISAKTVEKLAEIVDTKGWKPISIETVEGEKINLEGRVKSVAGTKLPQSKIESEEVEDTLEITP